MTRWRDWYDIAFEAADRLGLEANHDQKPERLTGSIDGFDVSVAVVVSRSSENSKPSTRLFVGLTGWPMETGLSLRHGRPWLRRLPGVRGKYITFDDPDWDDAYAVKAKDATTVRLQLTAERREAFRTHLEEIGTRNPITIGQKNSLLMGGQERVQVHQFGYQIINGILTSGFPRIVTYPDVIVDAVEHMLSLARALTR